MPHALRAFDERYSYTTPERRLMLAIVSNAIADALGSGAINNPGERDKVRREALAWFRSGGPDYQTVCHLAGLDPVNTRRAVLRYVASGNPKPRIRRTSKRTAPTEKIAA